MASDPVTVPVEVRLGPNLSAVADLVAAVDAAVRVIPDRHAEERQQLLLAAVRLKAACAKELRERKP